MEGSIVQIDKKVSLSNSANWCNQSCAHIRRKYDHKTDDLIYYLMPL